MSMDELAKLRADRNKAAGRGNDRIRELKSRGSAPVEPPLVEQPQPVEQASDPEPQPVRATRNRRVAED
jgi:hypothetical protein